MGVALSNLSRPPRQLELFGMEPGVPSPGPAIDAVRARFGYDAIRMGATGRSRWLEQRPATTNAPPARGERRAGDPPG